MQALFIFIFKSCINVRKIGNKLNWQVNIVHTLLIQLPRSMGSGTLDAVQSRFQRKPIYQLSLVKQKCYKHYRYKGQHHLKILICITCVDNTDVKISTIYHFEIEYCKTKCWIKCSILLLQIFLQFEWKSPNNLAALLLSQHSFLIFQARTMCCI